MALLCVFPHTNIIKKSEPQSWVWASTLFSEASSFYTTCVRLGYIQKYVFRTRSLQKKGPRLKVTDACCLRWRYLLSLPGCRVMSDSFLQSLLLILQSLVHTLQTLRWSSGGEIVRDELKSLQCTGFWKILCLNPPWTSRPTVHFSSLPSPGRYPRPSLEHLSCSGNRL